MALTIVHGQNALAVEERIRAIRAGLDPDGFSTTVIDINQAKLGDVRAALMSVPFFGGRRVVLIRGSASIGKPSTAASDNPEQEEEGDPSPTESRRLEWRDIGELLTQAPTTTDVICWINGALAANHALVKLVKAHGGNVEAFRIPRDQELLAWVSDRAGGLGVQITPDAVRRFLELLYPTTWKAETRWDTTTIDMRLLAAELEKLVVAAQGTQIDRALVEELIVDRGGYKAFQLGDQIFSGNVAGALRELEAMLAAGEPAERVIGQLSGDLMVRWAAAETIEFAPEDVAAALKTTTGRLNMNRGRSNARQSAAFARAAAVLRAGDIAVKTGHSPNATSTIVPLVAEITTFFQHRR